MTPVPSLACRADDVAAIMQVQGETLDRPYLRHGTEALQLEQQWQEVCKRADVTQ